MLYRAIPDSLKIDDIDKYYNNIDLGENDAFKIIPCTTETVEIEKAPASEFGSLEFAQWFKKSYEQMGQDRRDNYKSEIIFYNGHTMNLMDALNQIYIHLVSFIESCKTNGDHSYRDWRIATELWCVCGCRV